MAPRLAKFTTQADSQVLDEVRAIAAKEGKGGKPRPEIFTAFGESLAQNEALYKELAK